MPRSRGGRPTHVCTGNAVYRADALQRSGCSTKRSDTGTTTTSATGCAPPATAEACAARRGACTGGATDWAATSFSSTASATAASTSSRSIRRASPATPCRRPDDVASAAAGVAVLALASAPLAAASGWIVAACTRWRRDVGRWLALERLIAGVQRGAAVSHVRPRWCFRSCTSPAIWRGWRRSSSGVRALASGAAGRSMRPSGSMGPLSRPGCAGGHEGRVLWVVPAHNEATNLAAVVAEVRDSARISISWSWTTDRRTQTMSLLEQLDVRWLKMPERMGVGSAMRAGLRYSHGSGYDAVIRLDGDGQHRAEDIDRLLAPVHIGERTSRLDRGIAARVGDSGHIRMPRRLLAACLVGRDRPARDGSDVAASTR